MQILCRAYPDICMSLSCYVNSFHTYVLHGAYIGLRPKVCGTKEAYDLVDLACGLFALLQFYHKIVVFE